MLDVVGWVHKRADKLMLILFLVFLATFIASGVIQYKKYGSTGRSVRGSKFLETHQYRNINNHRGPGFSPLS